jgi:cytoskeletal protein CcmA (bactofilin family)
MAKKDKTTPPTSSEGVISIIGMGMTVTGDCETDGVIRVEGTVSGNVRAGKAIVVGKDGLVDGNMYTQDAVIAGRVLGSVNAVSRLELQPTSHILGDIEARRMKLEEGATLQGQVAVGEIGSESPTHPPENVLMSKDDDGS